MAIVKASFTRSRSKIKATLRYIIHRPGREGEKLTRELFGYDGEEMSKEDAYTLIDERKGMTFFHLKLNFHPTREDRRKDLNLQEITTKAMVTLEEQLQRTIRFLAVEHNDHSPLRHVHAIVLVKLSRGERVTWQDWKACRDVATEQALLQRKSIDIVRRYQRERSFQTSMYTRAIGMTGGRANQRARPFKKVRQPTLPCPISWRHSMVRLVDGTYWCRKCKRVQAQRQEMVREESQGLSL
jgi:hypothetical protein